MAADTPLHPRRRPRRRLRVLQIVLSLTPGGTERLVIEMVKRLSGEVDSGVLCLDGPGAWANEIAAAGVPLEALARRPGLRPGVGLGIASAARRFRADVIHCHQYTPFVYGEIAALLRPGLRLVFTEHGRHSDAPPSRKRRLANALLGKLRGRFYAVSQELRCHMIAEGFPGRRVGVVYNGIEPGPLPSAEARAAARRSLGLEGDPFVVGAVARLDPVKDLPTLVRALARLRAGAVDARAVIVGDGPERGAIEHAAREAGVGDHVLLTGHRGDARALLPGFDALANTSVSEGVSLTILEGMAAALPVMATRVGGTPEVVVDGDTGLLVPARDPEAVADALARLARAPAEARRLGARGRERLEERFTLDRMVEAYRRVYAGLADAPANRPSVDVDPDEA